MGAMRMENKAESQPPGPMWLPGVVASATMLSVVLNICIIALLLIEYFTHSQYRYLSVIFQAESIMAVIAAAALFLALLPMACFRKTRVNAVAGLILVSFVFLWLLWIRSVIVLYALWGITGLIGGAVLSCFFFGGLPGAAGIMTIINGEWPALWDLLLLTVFTYGTRVLGLYLGKKCDDEQAKAESVLK